MIHLGVLPGKVRAEEQAVLRGVLHDIVPPDDLILLFLAAAAQLLSGDENGHAPRRQRSQHETRNHGLRHSDNTQTLRDDARYTRHTDTRKAHVRTRPPPWSQACREKKNAKRFHRYLPTKIAGCGRSCHLVR